MSTALGRLARLLEDDDGFMASVLCYYAQGERLDDRRFAERLGCSEEALAELAVCRAPRHEPAEFQADVVRLAARFGIDAELLADVVREVRNLRPMRAAGVRGTLMAARDRDEKPPDGAGPKP